jgi:hypothetical protein
MTSRDAQSPAYLGVVMTVMALALLFWVMN